MTDEQMFIVIGVPLVFNATLITIVFLALNSRISDVGSRIGRLEDKFDMLMSKVVEIDSRVIRIEERLGIK